MPQSLIPSTRVRAKAVYEAWEVTEGNIETLAVQLKGVVIRDFTDRNPAARLRVGNVSVEPGEYLVRDESGQFIGMWQATYASRYQPLTPLELLQHTQQAINSIQGKTVSVTLPKPKLEHLRRLGLIDDEGKQTQGREAIHEALRDFDASAGEAAA